MTGGVRAALAAAVVLVGLALASAGLNALFPSQHGPTASSYATTPGGLAAYAELLARSGHSVTQLRRPPATGLLAASDTVVLLEPDALREREGRALAAFVRAGGRLIAGGSTANAFLGTILPHPPRWTPAATAIATRLSASPETAGVAEVTAAGPGAWNPSSAASAGLRAVLGASAPLLLAGALGRGHLALLADASPLENRLLGEADNARLGLDLAGAAGRRVVFVESVHGYGVARGLAALPGRWWWTIAGLTLAGVAWVAARWRRLGPPSVAGRSLPPARSAYLQAMTTILRRADAPVEVAGLARDHARRLVARRARIALPAAGAGDPAAAAAAAAPLDEAARRLGLSDDEARLLAGPGAPVAGDLTALATVLARLQQSPRERRASAGREPA